MVSIARKNLLEDVPRFLVAQAGIMFAVALVTLQTGIFNGFVNSTIQLTANSNADIWVASDTLVQLELSLPIPVAELIATREVEGVEQAEGLIFSGAQWYPNNGEMSRVRLVGFDPNGELFAPDGLVRGSVRDLSEPYTAIVDEADRDALGVPDIGGEAQVNSFATTVVGFTRGNTAMVSNAFTFVSLASANAYTTAGQQSSISCELPTSGAVDLECTNTFTRDPLDNARRDAPPAPSRLVASDLISYILVRAEPGQDIAALKQRLVESLPGTVAYTQQEIIDLTVDYWKQRTSIGFVLGMGAVVGIVVGVVVVSQILYSSVSDHLKEFGTLKAIGASSRQIYGIIIEQALWMAVLGYLPSMAACLGVAQWVGTSQGIEIAIAPLTAVGVFGLTIAMCIGSAIFAIQKVNHVDPALVFKA
ncbi:ABC-type antimicrobial peptide transport system, permease component [Rubidibacter lacunae KORDI 51-2]|uniref:ABC-type antimicrobial peptide transport system, permease component n=1 Tax=Rubidibacter lacunae KORDI 51-2 TaxID=582515 RepID=U5DKG6_9CHRO|nr:ABC-type antimicrobial peptide transport system, permease component [Rubidibacter lacunae KORDI 51-2]